MSSHYNDPTDNGDVGLYLMSDALGTVSDSLDAAAVPLTPQTGSLATVEILGIAAIAGTSQTYFENMRTRIAEIEARLAVLDKP